MFSSAVANHERGSAARGRLRAGAVLALAVVALASGVVAPATRAQDVTIGYQAVINPWKVAIADMAFEDATGYAIEWRRFDSSREIDYALFNGDIDIILRGSAGFATMLNWQIPYKLFWIAETIDTAEALVARNGSGIASPSDLRGKRIAAPVGSTTHFHLLFALEQFGIDLDEVLLVFLDPAEIVEAWEAERIDAAFVWYPALGQLLETGSVVITSGELAARGVATFDGMLVHNEFAEGNAGFMCRFVQILAEADANYRNDPESFGPGTENAAKIARLANADQASVAEVLALYEFLPLQAQAGPEWLGGGAARTLRATGQFFVEQGLLRPGTPDYAGAVTSEYVDAAIRGCPMWSGPATSVSQLLEPAWVRNASVAQVRKLVNLDADLSAVGSGYMLTALHVAAAWNQNPAVTELLLNRGADIDAIDALGRTALHVAATRNRNPAVAELLIARGASTQATDDKGWSVLEAARAGGNARIATIATHRAMEPAGVDSWRLLYSDWTASATVESLSRLLDFDTTLVSRTGSEGSLLHSLARFNPDPDVIALLLDRGADIRAVNALGENALFSAAVGKSPAIVALLVERGLPVDAANEYNETALFQAARWNEDPAMVAMFLDLGADLNGGEYSWRTALHEAAANKNHEVAALLLDRGADVAALSNFIVETPLMVAVSAGTLETTELLLDRGADPNQTASSGPSALHDAARHGKPKVVQLLLDRGARVGAADYDGNTALDIALRNPARQGSAAVVEALLEGGADRDKVDPEFWRHSAPRWLGTEPIDRVREWFQRIPGADQPIPDTFIEAAARNPDPAVTALLLDRGANPNTKGPTGHSLLHAAAFHGNLEVAALLIGRGANVNARDEAGSTPLHWALWTAEGAEMVSLLVDSGADVSATDDARQAPLHWAASWWTGGLEEAVRQLIDLGADPGAADQFDRTPLHWAARYNRAEVVEVLAAEATDLNAIDQGGATPLTLAGLNTQWAATQALLDRGSMVSALDERLLDAPWLSRATPIQLDAQVANASTKHLLQRDGCGRTPLHLVSHYAGRDLARVPDFNDRHEVAGFNGLLLRSALMDIDVPDRNGNTVMHYAVAGSAKDPPPNRPREGAPGLHAIVRLRSAGASTDTVGGGGLWPVHYASQDGAQPHRGRTSVVSYLSGRTDPSIDPLTNEPFVDGRVPADRLDSCVVDLP